MRTQSGNNSNDDDTIQISQLCLCLVCLSNCQVAATNCRLLFLLHLRDRTLLFYLKKGKKTLTHSTYSLHIHTVTNPIKKPCSLTFCRNFKWRQWTHTHTHTVRERMKEFEDNWLIDPIPNEFYEFKHRCDQLKQHTKVPVCCCCCWCILLFILLSTNPCWQQRWSKNGRLD